MGNTELSLHQRLSFVDYMGRANALRGRLLRITSFAAPDRTMWRILLLAFAAYSALAVAVTFPLILAPSSRILGDLGDPLLTASILSWNATVQPLTEQWWNGFGFFPGTNMMSFSEHFLGASLIATPLQWLGCSPITAYNLTLLASFPLCALAAHCLAYTLIRRHDAAVVCGLAYGFSPYRIAHIEHLELLMSFGMPVALAALHLYAHTRRARWLVVLAAALTIQGYSNSLYSLFFTVLLGMWMLWFMRPRAWREVLAIVATGGLCALIVSPIVIGYARAHEAYNVSRRFEEVLLYSADISSFFTASSLSVFWGWTSFLNGAERQLFPGLTITALAAVGALFAFRYRLDERGRLGVVSKALWALSAAFAAMSLGASVAGSSGLDWGWLTRRVDAPYKLLSVSIWSATAALAMSPALRGAFGRRSAFGFYLMAAAVLFLCSLGPNPAFLGDRVLWKPPYAALMRLPFFANTVRVPARFAMLAVLALSVAGAFAFSRLTLLRGLRRHRFALLLVVITGIVADGWVRGLPLATPPGGFPIPPGATSVAVLELPLGGLWSDTAAMYRSTIHGKRAVNGYNGFEPLYYRVLRLALAERDRTALEALASFGPILIAADNLDADAPLASFLSDYSGIKRLNRRDNWTFFQLPTKDAPLESCSGRQLAVTAAVDALGQPVANLADQKPATRWITPGPQRAGNMLTFDLGRAERPCGIVVSLGGEADAYPRVLNVSTSADKVTWETGFVGKMGGAAFLAALRNPRDAHFSIPLPERPARYVRLQLEHSHPTHPWAVADVIVNGR